VRLSGWHHCVDALNVRRIDVTGTTQLTLVFGGFLGQNVALESHTRFNGTTWTHAKTLLRGALGFHFWHNASALSDSSKVTGLQVATLCRAWVPAFTCRCSSLAGHYTSHTVKCANSIQTPAAVCLFIKSKRHWNPRLYLIFSSSGPES
jgi:hypothetical protein